MKILIDMCLSPQWGTALKDAGFNAVHWSEIGNPDAPDSEIFAIARRDKWIVFTNDLDFGTILSQTRDRSPSVIQLRTHDVSPRTQAETVVHVLRRHADALVDGALATIEPHRFRVRLLPLR